MTETPLYIVPGSGNLWRDFGYADADIRQAKGVIAARIIAVLDERGHSTRGAARETGFAAADFSRIRNADYGRFTPGRLIRMLHARDDGAEVSMHIGRRTTAGRRRRPRTASGSVSVLTPRARASGKRYQRAVP